MAKAERKRSKKKTTEASKKAKKKVTKKSVAAPDTLANLQAAAKLPLKATGLASWSPAQKRQALRLAQQLVEKLERTAEQLK